MNIQVEKWIFDGVASYHILNIEKCCDELIEDEDFITINNELSLNQNNKEDYSAKIRNNYDTYDGWDDCHSIESNYKTIKYCPFCGEKINIEIVNTIDKTEEYKKLTNERDELNEKRRKTDSKKEETELYVKIKILDKQINALYYNDSFSSYFERIDN